MYSFYYHIPSAMTEGKWNLVTWTQNNDKYAAARSVVVHYRGSEYPSEVEVWIKRKARAMGQAPSKVKKFKAREVEKWTYAVERIPDQEKAQG